MTRNVATVTELVGAGDDSATALSSPGGVPLSYRDLRAVIVETVAALNGHGIGRNDRVAIVLDNGPHMASAFLAVTAGATAAPLNPGYRAEEFEFYLTDLRAGLLIIEAGKEAGKASPAAEVAVKLGIPVARLITAPEGSARGAGAFTLAFPPTCHWPPPISRGPPNRMISRSSSTRRGRRRGPRSCRCRSATSVRRHGTCATHWH